MMFEARKTHFVHKNVKKHIQITPKRAGEPSNILRMKLRTIFWKIIFFHFFSKISFFIFCIFIIYMGSKSKSSWKWWHPRLQTDLKIFLSALETCYNNWGCSPRSGEHSALWIVVIQRLEKKRPTKNCRYR